MQHGNQLQQSIYQKVFKPAMDNVAQDVDGIVVGVDYFSQLVTVYYTDRHGKQETIGGLEIPKDADGVFRQAVKVGDPVRIGFKHGSFRQPYVSAIYKKAGQNLYFSKKGASIPRGIGYI